VDALITGKTPDAAAFKRTSTTTTHALAPERWSASMKTIQSLVVSAALAAGMAAPALAAQSDPERIIYRVAGVVDVNSDLATSFHWTNFSGVPETLRIVVRHVAGGQVANAIVTVPHLHTAVMSTRDVLILADSVLATGPVGGGTAAIAATSINFTCTAMVIQTNVNNAVGIALHMTRFNPIPATQE
jgi:hypothetical protein